MDFLEGSEFIGCIYGVEASWNIIMYVGFFKTHYQIDSLNLCIKESPTRMMMMMCVWEARHYLYIVKSIIGFTHFLEKHYGGKKNF